MKQGRANWIRLPFLALILALLPASRAVALAKQTPDPIFQEFDNKENAAREMNQLADARLKQVQSDIRILGNRIAAETVGKIYYPPLKASDGTGTIGCRPLPTKRTFDFQGQPSPRGQPLVYSQGELDAFVTAHLTFVAQGTATADQVLANFLTQVEQQRKSIEQIRSNPAFGENVQRVENGGLQFARYEYVRFCRLTYQLVEAGYAAEVAIRRREMSALPPQAKPFNAKSGLPGVACQLQSELLRVEASDEDEIQPMQSPSDLERFRAKAQACADRERSDLNPMAAKLRELRDRWLSERAQIKQWAEQWRQECIGRHFYEGEGDVAISKVYGDKVNLGSEGFSYTSAAFDGEVFGLLFNNGIVSNGADPQLDPPAMCPDSVCPDLLPGGKERFWYLDLTTDYPDLATENTNVATCLALRENAPHIAEELVSGAAFGQRP